MLPETVMAEPPAVKVWLPKTMLPCELVLKVSVPTTKLPCELAVIVWPFMTRGGGMVVVTPFAGDGAGLGP